MPEDYRLISQEVDEQGVITKVHRTKRAIVTSTIYPGKKSQQELIEAVGLLFAELYLLSPLYRQDLEGATRDEAPTHSDFSQVSQVLEVPGLHLQHR